ncbi:Putative protein [Zobellia galactanivorans]|uniref:Uncharacterized protein n=1 Tax=Zobellia galactanivorans (strain DSM 12802 / CCUG 47099 / CIP 106680 / NCIMB 13871 / Dsij) TaxID=63186 RepID=G0L479_ZOBGA|nr:Putative protein [Zobellia galactanivorans]
MLRNNTSNFMKTKDKLTYVYVAFNVIFIIVMAIFLYKNQPF